MSLPVINDSFLSQSAINEKRNYYESQSLAGNTWRAYRSDLKDFANWCESKQRNPVPCEVDDLIEYIIELADKKKVSTLERRLIAITKIHKEYGYESPVKTEAFRKVLQGIKRVKRVRPDRKKPLIVELVLEMVFTIPGDRKGVRDKALLLLGFSGAFRRSELVGLNIEDLRFNENGMDVFIKQSKGDQEGKGLFIGIPHGRNPKTCPVQAVKQWIDAADMEKGPLFRRLTKNQRVMDVRLSTKSVGNLVKEHVERIGLNPNEYGAHSLRAGFITTASSLGKSEYSIMKHSRHSSVQVFRIYIRESNLYENNACEGIGL